jgi:ABC-2 type transport system ATP-binding protein
MLRVNGLAKRLGDRDVLKHVAFAVEEGEVFGLLGANGAGKSTTVNIIAGLLTADAGTVTLADEPMTRERRTRLGVATQEIALYPTLTCEENLRFFARLYGLRRAHLRARVDGVIDRMGLATYRRARAETLSGGWKRRLNLAVALVHAPAVVLLDEPTAGLDVEARRLVWQQLRNLGAQRAAVVLTTHLLEEAEALCDRVAILARGRVAAQGTLEELRRLVPAAELAVIECDDEPLLRARAGALGLQVRKYGDRFTLLLPERTTVTALAGRLGEVGLHSIALQPVSLLQVYLEVGGIESREAADSQPALV